MVKIYEKKYDSESIVDIFRDVSECLNTDYNDAAKFLENLNYDEACYNVLFKFVPVEGEEQILISKMYDNDSFIDLESHIKNVFSEICVEKDDNGFFEGDLVISISVDL